MTWRIWTIGEERWCASQMGHHNKEGRKRVKNIDTQASFEEQFGDKEGPGKELRKSAKMEDRRTRELAPEGNETTTDICKAAWQKSSLGQNVEGTWSGKQLEVSARSVPRT